MKFGICDLAKHLKKAMDVVKDKLVDKSKDLADGAIDFMGQFVDGVKILGALLDPLSLMKSTVLNLAEK